MATNEFQQKEGGVMKKTKTAFVVIGVTVAVVLVGGWAFAHRPWGARGYGYGGCGHGYPYESSPYSTLTPEQREKLQAQEQKFFQDTAELRRELQQKKLELQGLWVDTKSDPEKIKAKQREVSDLQRRLQEKALEHRLAIRGLLPEEGVGSGSWCPGYGMGYGHHYRRGHMWGPGPGFGKGYGGGPCW
jgi:Spy/CpxP family protein refolding chaperone